MKLLLVQNHPIEGPGLVAECLERRGVPFDVAHAGTAASLPAPTGFNAVAVFGSPASCTRLDRHPELAAVGGLLTDCVRRGTPVLGICFGGQLLAQVLGAEVWRNEASEIGAYPVELTGEGKRSPYFVGFPALFSTAQWHSDTFGIPAGAELLATSPLCRNQAFSWRNCLGLQFHPEVSASQAGEWTEAYAEELPLVDKSADAVRRELSDAAEERARLCDLLVGNFLGLVEKD